MTRGFQVGDPRLREVWAEISQYNPPPRGVEVLEQDHAHVLISVPAPAPWWKIWSHLYNTFPFLTPFRPQSLIRISVDEVRITVNGETKRFKLIDDGDMGGMSVITKWNFYHFEHRTHIDWVWGHVEQAREAAWRRHNSLGDMDTKAYEALKQVTGGSTFGGSV